MDKLQISRIALSVDLAVGEVMSSFLLDWTPKSAEPVMASTRPVPRRDSPFSLWRGCGYGALTVVGVQRASHGDRAAAMISASYGTPFFFVPFLLPQSSWWAGIRGHEPRLGGVIVYPNLTVVGLFLCVTLVALGLALSGSHQAHPQNSQPT